MLQSAPYFIKWHILKKNLSLLRKRKYIKSRGSTHLVKTAGNKQVHSLANYHFYKRSDNVKLKGYFVKMQKKGKNNHQLKQILNLINSHILSQQKYFMIKQQIFLFMIQNTWKKPDHGLLALKTYNQRKQQNRSKIAKIQALIQNNQKFLQFSLSQIIYMISTRGMFKAIYKHRSFEFNFKIMSSGLNLIIQFVFIFFNNKMFSKLDQNTRNKTNLQDGKLRSVSKTKPQKQRSYSAMQKQKKNSSELYDYQIAWICDHLYQGCFQKNKKHGQGILIMPNGVVVVGNWNNGDLDGYALFISPFGGKIHTHYCKGLLQGFVIVQYKDSFQILSYKKDIKNPIKRRYDQFQQLWTQASYHADGRLQTIHLVQKTKDFSLPSWIKDSQLINLYNQIIMKGQTRLRLEKIKNIKINDKFQYYGYVNSDLQKIPKGLGVIFSDSEIYAGNFSNGSLDQYGLILFENGLVYKGQIYAGKIWGDGAIYDINLDETKCVRVCQQGIQLIISQEEGFNLENIPFSIGKIPSSQMNGQKGFSYTIQSIFSQIVKYYYRSNSAVVSPIQTQETNSQIKEQSNYSSQGYNDYQQSSSKTSTPKQKSQSLSNQEKTQRNSRIYFEQKNRLQSSAVLVRQKKPSNTGSLSLSIQPDNQIQSTDKKYRESSSNNQYGHINFHKYEGSLQRGRKYGQKQLQQTNHLIPSYTPTFQQIAKKTKSSNQSYPLYPYLMQFQMSKNVLSPHIKFSKIGKIVANSIKIAEGFRI